MLDTSRKRFLYLSKITYFYHVASSAHSSLTLTAKLEVTKKESAFFAREIVVKIPRIFN